MKNKAMKYVAEQDRKFTDMGGVKIHHSIYPVVYPVSDNGWGPVIRFDNKHILAGGQEVQCFAGNPVQIVRMMVNGTASYYDSTGYRAVLNNNDILLINTGNEALQSVLNNAEETEDNELIEIWLQSGEPEKKYAFHSGPAKRETGRFYTLIALEQTNSENGGQKIGLRIGSFAGGGNHEIKDLPAGHSVILFILNGSVTANGSRLAYRDTVIFCEADVSLEFERAADIFLMEIKTAEINKEVIK
jgi:redox-sensitive bicupin YhaK (pirin superfamily)